MTNDGATILSLLDVEHPAGKILVELAQQQDKEVKSMSQTQLIYSNIILGWGWYHHSRHYCFRAFKTSK